MALDPALREMIGDQLANAVDAARDRLANETIMARCAEGLWSVEVDGDVVADSLSQADAIAALDAIA